MARIFGLFWLLPMGLLLPNPAAAQCQTCNWADRGDRFEGVLNQPSAAGTCDFLGVQAKRAGEASKGARSLYLHFWLPGPETPVIEVWQKEKNYWMVPKNKKYHQGLQTFSWARSEVIEPLGVNIDSLYVRISNAEKTLYFPTLLSSDAKPASSPEGYVFTFDCSAGIEVAVTILREEEGRLQVVRTFPYSKDYGGISRIEWDGKGETGRKVPPGVYVLRLKGDLMTETLRRLNRNISFQHHDLVQ